MNDADIDMTSMSLNNMVRCHSGTHHKQFTCILNSFFNDYFVSFWLSVMSLNYYSNTCGFLWRWSRDSHNNGIDTLPVLMNPPYVTFPNIGILCQYSILSMCIINHFDYGGTWHFLHWWTWIVINIYDYMMRKAWQVMSGKKDKSTPHILISYQVIIGQNQPHRVTCTVLRVCTYCIVTSSTRHHSDKLVSFSQKQNFTFNYFSVGEWRQHFWRI